MLATLQALYIALRTAATSEARSLSRVLFFLIMNLYIVATAQSVFGHFQEAMLIFGIFIVALSVIQIFRVDKLIRLTVIGETLELARITPRQPGIISNKLIDVYWGIAIKLTVIITAFCIATPFMPLWREWWLPILWPTIFILVAIGLGSIGTGFFKFLLVIEMIALILITATVIFPQVNAQLRIGELKNRFLRSDIADDVNDIDKIRQQQRNAEIKRDLEEISRWVQENPNAKYSEDYLKFLQSVKNGERKTLNEIRYEILHPEVKVKEKSDSTLTPPEWELYKDFGECKFVFSGRGVFSNTVGPNGEKAGTAEVYSGCFLEQGYEHKITFKGGYKNLFKRLPFHEITWKGWDPQSENIRKPFPEYPYGALMLRIGNQHGIHPEKGQDFIIISDMEGANIYGELNKNREHGDYVHPTMGSKVVESTLTIEIRRRPLQR